MATAETETVAVLGAGGTMGFPIARRIARARILVRVQPIFDAIGQRTIRVGEAGAGARLKLVTNNWVQSVVESAAETIALAERLGLDPDLFFKAIEGGARPALRPVQGADDDHTRVPRGVPPVARRQGR